MCNLNLGLMKVKMYPFPLMYSPIPKTKEEDLPKEFNDNNLEVVSCICRHRSTFIIIASFSSSSSVFPYLGAGAT